MAAVNAYFRLCPSCASENAPDVMRCACGMLLAGIDLQIKENKPVVEPVVSSPKQRADGTHRCSFADCGADNPADATHCLYCNRLLVSAPVAPSEPADHGLIRLPEALSARYRIVRAFPASGAEAELVLVEPEQGGAQLMAKIYRRGIFPKAAVLERVLRVDTRYRVNFIETGQSDGHAYELMEFCALGSLRNFVRPDPLKTRQLQAVTRELAAALAALHAAELVHRDLKPDNVLIRSESPLQLVLTDFGIASVLDATQRFTGTARTLHYAAPESLSGIIDSKTDYWALGMLLLELALGKHPFSGLSDPVILHHLTTRSIDLAAVADPNFRKLLRGLLLRDPEMRWGGKELTRWLANDFSLPEPQDVGAIGFSSPYRLRGELCLNPEHLAVALARHWQAGVSDVDNGQLLTWFRDVEKDHDTVRLLLEMKYERALHLDVQLLRLILHLAPGIPPVWRGESIELKAILGRASRALKGDGEAVAWLDALYQHRVLEAYADAGNAAIEKIVKSWNRACDAFVSGWKEQLALLKAKKLPRAPHEVVDYDAALYGSDVPDRPPLSSLHARLLAFAFDSRWENRMRQHLQNEIIPLKIHCPWLDELGDPQKMSSTQLLVLESLLPEAMKEAKRQQAARTQAESAASKEEKALAADAASVMENLRNLTQETPLNAAHCARLASALSDYYAVLARLRANIEKISPEIHSRALRVEPLANQLRRLLDQLHESRAITGGWLDFRVIGLCLLLATILPRIVGNWIIYLMLACAGVLFAWRLLPEYFVRQQIRKLLERIYAIRNSKEA